MNQINRASLRLNGYDYTQPGPYFFTTITYRRESLFGEILDGKMLVNPFGQVVADAWLWLGQQFPYLELGESVVMPDHFHGIIFIGDIPRSGGSRPAATGEMMRRPAPTGGLTKIKPLGQLVGAFKTVSAKQINALRGTPGQPVWQRSFYDRIIRDEAEMGRIHQYILDNPMNWQEGSEQDPFH